MTDIKRVTIGQQIFRVNVSPTTIRITQPSTVLYRVRMNHPGTIGPTGPQGAQGEQGDAGPGLPAGGTAGQVIEKIDGTDYNTQWVEPPSAPVASVNGEVGIVVLDTDDIDEGATNLYYTEARVDANTNVAANTAARHTHANIAVLDATTASFLIADETKLDGIEAGAEVNVVDSVNTQTGAVVLNTSHVAEVTNLYYTEARVDANTNVAANSTHRLLVGGENPHGLDIDDIGGVNIDEVGNATSLNTPVNFGNAEPTFGNLLTLNEQSGITTRVQIASTGVSIGDEQILGMGVNTISSAGVYGVVAGTAPSGFVMSDHLTIAGDLYCHESILINEAGDFSTGSVIMGASLGGLVPKMHFDNGTREFFFNYPTNVTTLKASSGEIDVDSDVMFTGDVKTEDVYVNYAGNKSNGSIFFNNQSGTPGSQDNFLRYTDADDFFELSKGLDVTGVFIRAGGDVVSKHTSLPRFQFEHGILDNNLDYNVAQARFEFDDDLRVVGTTTVTADLNVDFAIFSGTTITAETGMVSNSIDEFDNNNGVSIDGLTIKDGSIPEGAVTEHEAAITHQNLSGAGTNTHAQIDTHIADTDNPHGITGYENLVTGILTGGAVTINGGDPAKVDITAGTGYIINWSVPTAPTVTPIFWNARTALTIPDIATTAFTRLEVTADDTIVQTGDASAGPADRRQAIQLSSVIHAGTVINFIACVEQIAYENVAAIIDYIEKIGPINEGNTYTDSGANLEIDKLVGITTYPYINHAIDAQNPSVRTDATQLTAPISRSYQDGLGDFIIGVPETEIDAEFYDDGSGTLAAMPLNKWQIKHFYFFGQTENTVATYGQATYNNLAAAEAAIFTEQPLIADLITDNGTNTTVLIVQQGATDLSDPLQAKFVNVFISGAAGGGGGTPSAVDSVNGKVGVVVLTTTDIAEGSNLYYTEARVDANTNVAANTVHSGLTSGNPHDVLIGDIGPGTFATGDITVDGDLDVNTDLSVDGTLTVAGVTDYGNTVADPYVRIDYPRRGVVRFVNEHGTAFPGDSQGAWLEFDRETSKFGWNLNAGGGGIGSTILYFNNITPTMQDGKDFQFGGQSSCSIRFQNPSGSDGAFLNFRTHVNGTAECTGVFAFQGKSTRYTGQSSDPLYVDPRLRIYSGDADSTHWTESYHDQTDGYLVTGAGDINIEPASAQTNVTGDLDISGEITGIEEAIEIVIDGGGVEITTGIVGDLVAKSDMTITGWTILADQTGSVAVDVWVDTYANYPPVDADSLVTPSITSATKNQTTGLSLSVTKGDILRFNVDSVTDVERVTVALTGVRG